MAMTNNLLNREFTRDVCYELLPEWKGVDVRITELKGGITNKLYRVRSEKGDHTVRIYGDKTDLFIDRDYEVRAQREMAGIGVTSDVVKYMPDKGVTIVEFIGDSIVLTNDHFLDKTLHPAIVDPIRRIHKSGVKLDKIFNPLVEVRKMASILDGLDASYPEFDIAGVIERLGRLDEVIAIPEDRYTACHNDLLADNFILIDEDARRKWDFPMYLIDWEYAGMAPRFYDVADMFQEILAPRDAEKRIVREYADAGEFDRDLYYIDLFKPFPDIYWFLWSLIQLNISKIEFDYYNYGKVKYENAVGNFSFIGEEYDVKV